MSNHDQTSMGGKRGTFLTTHWSLIEDVKKQPDKDRALIGLLLERYWKPVYCYLRRKGHDNEQAKDLTQGFFHEVVLSRHLLERADSEKGRFRTLLLHTLNQYLTDEHRKETAQLFHRLWFHRPVVDADVVDQTGPKSIWGQSATNSKIQAAV